MCELTNQGRRYSDVLFRRRGLKETGVKTEGENSAVAEKSDVFLEYNMSNFIKICAYSDREAYLEYKLNK